MNLYPITPELRALAVAAITENLRDKNPRVRQGAVRLLLEADRLNDYLRRTNELEARVVAVEEATFPRFGGKAAWSANPATAWSGDLAKTGAEPQSSGVAGVVAQPGDRAATAPEEPVTTENAFPARSGDRLTPAGAPATLAEAQSGDRPTTAEDPGTTAAARSEDRPATTEDPGTTAAAPRSGDCATTSEALRCSRVAGRRFPNL
jgi:hypothetical protein